MTNIEFLQGNAKVYESKQVVANEVTAPDRKAVIFQIDLPLQSLKPGFYTCQVNVIDDNAGNFAFPRWPILVKESQPSTPPPLRPQRQRRPATKSPFVGAGFTPPEVNATSIVSNLIRPKLLSPHETPNSPPARRNKSRTAATPL